MTMTSVSLNTGDTITWECAMDSHALESRAIPAGATGFNFIVNDSIKSYRYVPVILGTYNYSCTFGNISTPASFTVVTMAGVANVSSPGAFNIYPNPATESITVNLAEYNPYPVTLSIRDIFGKEVWHSEYDLLKETNIDLRDLPDGVYFLEGMQWEALFMKEFVVAHNIK